MCSPSQRPLGVGSNTPDAASLPSDVAASAAPALHRSSSALSSPLHLLFLSVPLFQSKEEEEWRQIDSQRWAPPMNLLPEAMTSVGLMDGPALGVGRLPAYNQIKP